MLKIQVYYPFLNNLPLARLAWMEAEHLAGPGVSFTVLDNASYEKGSQWAKTYLPERWNSVLFETNQTMWDSLRFIEKTSRGQEDIIGVLHCDSFLFSDKWGYTVRAAFQQDPKLGIAALFGATVCHPDGIRGDCVGALVDIGGHGRRIYQPQYVSILDGFAMFYNPAMLHELGQNMGEGYWDQGQYDYDISLESLRLGYHNRVLHIPCTHLSGISGASAVWGDYLRKKYNREDGFQFSEKNNYQNWCKKWSRWLPVRSDDQGNPIWTATPPSSNTAFSTLIREG